MAVFLLWREIFITTGKKKVPVVMAGVSVFGSGGKLAVVLLWQEIFITTEEKKSSSRLSGGCVSFWFWREIGSFFVVARNFHYDRKKKFQSSVWRVCQFLILAGNRQFFCCGGKFSLRPE